MFFALSIALSTTTSCAIEHRAAARFVDPELREAGIAYTSDQRARVISAGPWELRRVPASALADPPSVPGAAFETQGDGRPAHRERYVFQTFYNGASAPSATTACASSRRQGPEAALASAAELPSDEVSLSCVIDANEATYSLTLRGRLDQNLRGEWGEQPPPSSGARASAERRGGRVEVLLHHQIWGRVPARTPTAIVQLFGADPGAEDASLADPSERSIRAVAAASLDRRGTVWMSPSLDEIAAARAVSILGAHIFAPFPWEQAS